MRVREPVNTWSHLAGLVLATAGTVLLLRLARGSAQTVAFAVYGGSLVLLYAASTVYHALPLPPQRLHPLRTLDHIAIYFLIAGTYTPVALVTLAGRSGWALLTAVSPIRPARSSSPWSVPIRFPVASGTMRSGTCWCSPAAASTLRSCCSTSRPGEPCARTS